MNRIERVIELLNDAGITTEPVGELAEQIDQLYKSQPDQESPMYLDGKGQWQIKPDQSSRLLMDFRTT